MFDDERETNYPSLSDSYKYAAYDGLGALARFRAQAPPGDGRRVRLKATFKKLTEQSSRVSPMGPEELAGLYQRQVLADDRSYPRTGNGVIWRT